MTWTPELEARARELLERGNRDPYGAVPKFLGEAPALLAAALAEIERLRNAVIHVASWEEGFASTGGNCTCPSFAEAVLAGTETEYLEKQRRRW